MACSVLILSACQSTPLVSTQAEEGTGGKILSQKETPTTLSEKQVDAASKQQPDANAQKPPEQTVKPKGITPAKVKIPAINVDANITPQGLNEENDMEVPSNGDEVGWFEPGTKPGNTGNAILAGHVDDKEGPAVFFDLKELKAGDKIYVTDENGKQVTFEVDKVVAYDKNNAPLRQIFGPSEEQNLNLLTCTGTFDHSIQDHEERLVVYTSLLPN
ncbi:class F sortase [Pontibacillus salicampi]|uniref:Class F sortase n=1 Tax=Pontibacillus salicampi TaxID=1449801 RepID=A0ABV6LI34_9BACI